MKKGLFHSFLALSLTICLILSVPGLLFSGCSAADSSSQETIHSEGWPEGQEEGYIPVDAERGSLCFARMRARLTARKAGRI